MKSESKHASSSSLPGEARRARGRAATALKLTPVRAFTATRASADDADYDW